MTEVTIIEETVEVILVQEATGPAGPQGQDGAQGLTGGNSTAADLGATGDGATNDTAAFSQIDTDFSGATVDLAGLSYVVDAIPDGAEYTNGDWIVGGVSFPAETTGAMILSSTGTGSIGNMAGSSSSSVNVPFSGRTNSQQLGVIGSRNGLAEGTRSAVIYSFDCRAAANIAGAMFSRDTSVMHNTSASVAVEDGYSQAKKAGQFACIRPEATGESYTFSAASQDVSLQAEHSGAVAVGNYRSGGGYGARFTVTLSGDAIQSISVTGGASYADTETLIFEDVLGSGTGAAATMTSTSGVPQSISVTAGGTGYSDTVGIKISVAGIGSYQFAAGVTGVSTNDGDVTAMLGGRQGVAEAGSLRSGMLGFDQATLGPNAEYAALVGSGGGSYLNAIGAVIAGGTNVTNEQTQSVALGGRNYIVDSARTIVTGNGTGTASTANRTWQVNCENGNVASAGTFTGSVGFADYAYMLENLSVGVIPVGTLAAMDGDKVRPARAVDDVVGAVSAHALIVANDSPFAWGGRYMVDDFGGVLADADGAPIENPSYDPEQDNTPRSERPEEWSKVGIIGQLHVRCGPDLTPNDYVCSDDGARAVRSTGPTGIRCMKITSEYDSEKGYGVALCFKS